MSNLFEAMPLMIGRLRDAFAANPPAIDGQPLPQPTIESASILAGQPDPLRYCPALFLMPDSTDMKARAGQGAALTRTQRYAVVVCVRHVATTGWLCTESLAGAYAATAYAALGGWVPEGISGYQSMGFVSQEPIQYRIGYAELGLIFEHVNHLIGPVSNGYQNSHPA